MMLILFYNLQYVLILIQEDERIVLPVNDAFPRIITLLRKEKGISQKQAAVELQVSQALLSHYEKGIRECGLDFLVRAANYYQVSCDYLLGRTPDRTGAVLTVEDLPDADFQNNDKQFKGSVLAVLNKKLVTNSMTIVFDLLQKSGNRALIHQVSAFMMLGVYLSFRLVYATDAKNPQGLFEIPSGSACGYALAAMQRAMTDGQCTVHGLCAKADALEDAQRLALSPEVLKEQYPYFYQSLTNLIQRAEKEMKS